MAGGKPNPAQREMDKAASSHVAQANFDDDTNNAIAPIAANDLDMQIIQLYDNQLGNNSGGTDKNNLGNDTTGNGSGYGNGGDFYGSAGSAKSDKGVGSSSGGDSYESVKSGKGFGYGNGNGSAKSGKGSGYGSGSGDNSHGDTKAQKGS